MRHNTRHSFEAFGPDHDFAFLLEAMKAKLENMADYFRTQAPIANGSYYASQMERAASILDIVIRDGGRDEYREEDPDKPEDWHSEELFIPRVNMRNSARFPDRFRKVHCDSEPQRIRFNKAWHLFLRILNEQMLNNWVD